MAWPVKVEYDKLHTISGNTETIHVLDDAFGRKTCCGLDAEEWKDSDPQNIAVLMVSKNACKSCIRNII